MRHAHSLILSGNLMLDPQLVGHHRDEFAIRRFRFRDINRITEKMADAVDIAALMEWDILELIFNFSRYLLVSI